MYGEIDGWVAPRGGVTETVTPQDFLDPTYFERGDLPPVIFVPTSAFDQRLNDDWVKALEEAAAYCKTRLVWLTAASDHAHLQALVQTLVTLDEVEKFIGDLDAEVGAVGETTVEPVEGSPSLLDRFKKWAQAETQMASKQGHTPPLDIPARKETSGGNYPSPSYSAPSSGAGSDTLKDYIRMKEDELRDLKSQISIFEDENLRLLREIETYRNDMTNLEKKLDTLRGRLLFLEEENESLRRQKGRELDALRGEFKNKVERLAFAENALREQELKFEDLRDRVKRDLFSVQERERYLEARMEILKRDTEVLLHQKDERILELQEKMKQMEFKNEAFQEALQNYKESDQEEQDRSRRIVRALKLATSLLDTEGDQVKDGDIRKREG
jgi:hypothetical protein